MHNRKASNALCKTRKEKFPGPGENCQRNLTDLAGSLVTSSRPPGRPPKRPDDRTRNAGVSVRTADGSRRTADGPLHKACTTPAAEERPAVQLVVCRRWLSPRTYFRVLLTTRAAAFSNRWSLSVVAGLGCPSENGVAVVHA